MFGDNEAKSYRGFTASMLLAAMAPQEIVLSVFFASRQHHHQQQDDHWSDNCSRERVPSSVHDTEQDSCWKEQESFAALVNQHWRSDYPPSTRYIAYLVKLYIQICGDRNLQSEALMELYLELCHRGKKHGEPDPYHCCYGSFTIPVQGRDQQESCFLPLRIRMFPYHNDVSLRLWEAGAVLAEYLVENANEWVRGKRVVELGAGVGATGLVVAGWCGATHVLCTDYTDCALANMRHNFALNQEWLRQQSRSAAAIQVAHLEWDEFGKDQTVTPTEYDRVTTLMEQQILAGDVLLAADVAYDRSVIRSLVKTVQRFLCPDPDKVALFATTRRNMETFRLLYKEIVSQGITCRPIATEKDCGTLPILFPKKFHQNRSDVEIWALSLVPSS